MGDLFSDTVFRAVIQPIRRSAVTVPVVGTTVDRRGFRSVTFILLVGDTPVATDEWLITVEHGDASNLSDAAVVSADQLIGTVAGMNFDGTQDGLVGKIGYKGAKPYVRLNIDDDATGGANSGLWTVCVIVALGDPLIANHKTQQVAQ